MGKKVKKEVEPPPKDAFDPLPIESKQAATVVLMLDSPEEDVLAKACEAIHRFAEKGDENRSSLLGLGAMEPLTRLISHEDKTVRRNAFMAVGVMASNSELGKKKFSTAATITQLKLLLIEIGFLTAISYFPIIQQLSLQTLESITKDAETRTAFRVEQGFNRLLELLTTKEFSDLHVDALRVISNCLEDTESTKLIQGTGVLEKLLQFIITPTSPEVQTNAVKAISRVAQNSENRKILHEQDVEKALIDMLVTENEGVRTAVCRAVAVMSNNLSSKDTFRNLDGIRPIVQLLNSEGNEVKEAAAQALSSLTNGNELNAYAVSEAKGEELLVRLLQDSCSGAVIHAASVLTNMASQEALRCNIITHCAMKALLEPLQSTDNHTLISATQAVAALACNADGRAELRNAGGLLPLVKLLKSNNTEIRRNACWAVSVCANDEPTATEMCKLGALEILQEINCSLNRKNKFSEAALQRLLDSNLSVKYSLTGCLSHTDIIADGFYDPGQVEKNTLLLSCCSVNPYCTVS
uniref:ARMC5-like ARM-repeats domain-containing protein n=1 Tax=Pygocentrus nattereri TaxID=42514 RepID=A0AAR2LBN5_PYGNA